ncbi:winged helix-turn-helix domain-containing protein [Pseudomarimonas arenosa]|uniref:PD40 domain-containing protein n=1 Tax=Pseudomarimonas arenosa TaxID=2774145 RepID=A0AAW3ZRT1_9GAMM|nr:winged helix-turn-helix domain-containing protein [Pseudomarimonas arenosa]MBD8526956.1 PD40 domain-containing protein [Pseudomarimonas arenosa]
MNRLSRAEQSISLEPRVMDTLVYLAQHPGRPVSRDELLEKVWQRVVCEQSVNRNIAELRKALGDDSQAPRYIETIPKRGYRLIAEVSPLPVTAAATPRRHLRWVIVAAPLGLALAIGAIWWLPAEPSWNQTAQFQSLSALTEGSSETFDPAIDPAGRSIVYAQRAAAGERSHLFRIQADGAGLQQLTSADADDYSPDLSADALSIVFVRRSAGVCRIMLLTLDAEAKVRSERELLRCGESSDSRVIWAENDTSIAFTDRDSFATPYRVFLFDLNTGEKQQLTNPETNLAWDYKRKGAYRGYGDYWLARAPDRSGFLFARNFYGEETDVFEMKWRERKPIEVFEWGWQLGAFSYNASSDGLIYNDTPNSLVEHRFSDGDRQTLLQAESEIYAPVLGPAGDRLLHIVSQQRWQIWQRKLGDADEPGALIASSSHEYFGQYAHHSERLVFVSQRSGQPELWLREQDGQQRQLLRSPFWIEHKPLRWAPDDSAILLEVSNVLLSVDTADGTVRQHTPDSSTHLPEHWVASAPAWSRDGRHIYFASDRSGSWQIWRVSRELEYEWVADYGVKRLKAKLSDSDFQQITTRGGYSARESLDGQWLYFSKPHEHGLWRMPVTGGDEVLLIADFDADHRHHWEVHVDGIYYRPNTGNPSGIYRFDLEQKSSSLIAEDVPNQGRQFSLSADRSSLVFNRREGRGSQLYAAR